MSSMPHDPVKSAASPTDDITAKLSQTTLNSDCAPMAAVCGIAVLVVGGLIVAVIWYKFRGAKADWRRTITSLQNLLQKKESEEQENISSLQGLMRDLEAQGYQVKEELQRVKAQIEDNKRQLQSVEEEITVRQRVFDNTEELLRHKENLLQAQWRLDETKKNTERQIQNIEKVLGPIEIQVSRMNRNRGFHLWI